MGAFRYAGFYDPRKFFEDSSVFWNNILSETDLAKEAVKENAKHGMKITKEMASEALEFLKNFPPETAHRMMVGHQVDVFGIESPAWEPYGKAAIPAGNLKNMFSSDIGVEIGILCDKEMALRNDLGPVHIATPYGESALGLPVRADAAVKYGQLDRILLPNDYLTIFYNPFARNGGFTYAFDLKTSSKTSPFEVRVKTYVNVDSKNALSRTEVARPSFLLDTSGNPGRFEGFVYK